MGRHGRARRRGGVGGVRLRCRVARRARGRPAFHRGGAARYDNRTGHRRRLRPVPDRPRARAERSGLGVELPRRTGVRGGRRQFGLSARINARGAAGAAAAAGRAASRCRLAVALPGLRRPAAGRSRRGADHRPLAARVHGPRRGARRRAAHGRRPGRGSCGALRWTSRRGRHGGRRPDAVGGWARCGGRARLRGDRRIRVLVRARLLPGQAAAAATGCARRRSGRSCRTRSAACRPRAARAG